MFAIIDRLYLEAKLEMKSLCKATEAALSGWRMNGGHFREQDTFLCARGVDPKASQRTAVIPSLCCVLTLPSSRKEVDIMRA